MLGVVLALVACALFGAAFLLRGTALQAKKRLPPGPPAWPVLGHLHLLGDLPHQSLCKLSKIYGPLMSLRFGCIPTVVVSSPAMAKEFLQTHDLTFAHRPRSAAAVYMLSNCTNMGFAPYGPYWKLLRQLFTSELFSTKRLEASKHVREEEIHTYTCSLFQTVSKNPGELVQPRENLLLTFNNSSCRLAMGKRISEVSNLQMGGKGDVASLVEEMMYLLSMFNVGDYIPWLAWLDLQGYEKRMKVTGRRGKEVMQAVIDERRESYKLEPKAERQNDLLDVLLHAAAQDDGVPITDDNIMAVILDVFLAGSETTSVATEWALADLINHPEVMRKVQEELDEVVGKERLVKEADIPALPCLGAVVKESMRLHPVAPLLIPHESAQDCEIGGYHIPARTRLYVNTWAISRDPAVWERPTEFWPERFRDSTLELRGQSFELMPFGSGRRRCPGWPVGLLNVHLMLAALVQGFNWSLAPPEGVEAHGLVSLDMSERFGITVAMAKPLQAYITPRLPSKVY